MSLPNDALSLDQLPQGEGRAAIETPHFPTRWQAALWRNWELVPLSHLAAVLSASEEQLLQSARELGLRVPPQTGAHWLEHGYITLIRVNWHLLSYEQLLQLLGWTPERLDHTLREDDFLWIKLGFDKPSVAPPQWNELTPDQRERTAQIRTQVEAHFPDLDAPDAARPFDFLRELQTPPSVLPRLRDAIRPDEIELNDAWHVQGAETPDTEAFAARFSDEMRARWGTAPRLHGNASGPVLKLSVLRKEGARRESHSITVAPQGIEIEAVDEAGLLRGLQWLQSECEARGGPYLLAGHLTRDTRFDLRLIYPYCGVYGDPLANAEVDPLPEGLLARYAKLGVNGVWLQGLLWSLAPWEHAPELSAGWQQRLENLRGLCARAAKWGIGVYLYLNEPRGLPPRFFEEHPELQEWRGLTDGISGVSNLCSSVPEVRRWLFTGTAHLFREVPELAGVFTITMSENLTNCHSHYNAEGCPRCRLRPAADVVSEINAAIHAGATQAKPDARVIAWLWGYNNNMAGDAETQPWSHDAIAQLPSGVEVMATSEEALPTNIAGYGGTVFDYTMSQVGPSPLSRAHWQTARAHGLNAVAKVQFNNTWENSAVPYIPVPDLIEEHLRNLEDAGVSGLLLSWTLGGFPSPNLELASRRYWREYSQANDETETATPRAQSDLDELAGRNFGGAGGAVRAAWALWSKAFREFPFHIGGLYHAPYNYGPMNLLHTAPTGRSTTMIGYPFDALDTWRSIYPREVYREQFRILRDGWREGLETLQAARAELTRAAPPDDDAASNEKLAAFDALERVARACRLHWRSVHSQIEWICLRDELLSLPPASSEKRENIKARLREIIDEEIAAARELHDLVRYDSLLGYEASNHYYYTLNDLREKVIACEYSRAAVEAM